METKFTPGPWVVSEDNDNVSVSMGTAIDSPYEYTCGHVWEAIDVYWHEADEEDRANANLISAAPDLYHALESFVNNSSCQANHPEECETAEKALAKARGEE